MDTRLKLMLKYISFLLTGNINASSATGVSTVGILTAYSSININVGGGSTEIATELSNKTSPGKAIALCMVFGR